MKRSDIGVQFLAYLVVGGSSTFVDLGGFALLQWLGVPLMVASASSFVAGTLFNYFASYALAFRRGLYGRTEEVSRLFVVALVGLLLNSAFVWVFVHLLGVPPMWAKTIAVPCVLAWNFLGRRWLVFHKELPDLTWDASTRLLGASDDPKEH
jgi:putative flippase GtrA